MKQSVRGKVKIVCTLGPASCTSEKIEALIQAGMNVARLNFSHGTHEFHQNLIEQIRAASKKLNTPIAILQDLQGPKIRAGKLPTEGLMLEPGSQLKGGHLAISAEIATSVSRDIGVGAQVLFDDGKIVTEVVEVNVPEMRVVVKVGGKLTSHKGMNLPGTPLRLSCLTSKDIQDLEFGLKAGVDLVALSFVRKGEDLVELRAHMDRILGMEAKKPWVVSKIEREEAIEPETQASILEGSDCLMVARGDLAVELGPERVPSVQKALIQACIRAGKPVITATQMMESMIHTPTPTRAEVSDVANAVFDGTDAVMLSAESASGQYPAVTVASMVAITEDALRHYERWGRVHHDLDLVSESESLCLAAAEAAEASERGLIVTDHMSASEIAKLSRLRAVRLSICMLTQDAEEARKAALLWGVESIVDTLEDVGDQNFVRLSAQAVELSCTH
jgi:pyruvate kinase